MRFQGLMLVCGCLLATCAGAGAAKPAKETPRAKALAQLEGQWTLVAENRNGRATPAKEVKARRMTLIIRGDTVTIRAPGTEQESFRMEIDPSDSPRAVDLFAQG